jgi:hypothetical protein
VTCRALDHHRRTRTEVARPGDTLGATYGYDSSDIDQIGTSSDIRRDRLEARREINHLLKHAVALQPSFEIDPPTRHNLDNCLAHVVIGARVVPRNGRDAPGRHSVGTMCER